MGGTKYAIAFQEETTGEIRIAHYYDPTTELPAIWTTAFGVPVAPPTTILNWKAVGGA